MKSLQVQGAGWWNTGGHGDKERAETEASMNFAHGSICINTVLASPLLYPTENKT